MVLTEENILAKGHKGNHAILVGEVFHWNIYSYVNVDCSDKIVYVEDNLPLYQAAIIASLRPKGVILAYGSHNYHPLIFFKDLLIPCIAGTGTIHNIPKRVVVDCYAGTISNWTEQKKYDYPLETDNKIFKELKHTYANVGSEEAIIKAYEFKAAGIGIFRTEFTAVRALLHMLDYKISPEQTLEQFILEHNEADAIYLAAKIPELCYILKNIFVKAISLAVNLFPEKPVIIRSIDIEREENDALGYRGIRRCIAEGGGVLRIIARAINEVIQNEGAKNITILFPLVSSYSQLSQATKIIQEEKLTILTATNQGLIKVGWKIEQPAAILNNQIWMRSYFDEFGTYPHSIGIGTNDLTQFTLGVGRNIDLHNEPAGIKSYIDSLYNEHDPSIVKQLILIAKSGVENNTEVILHGEMAAEANFAKLLLLLRITPSVTISKLTETDTLIEILTKESINLTNAIFDIFESQNFSTQLMKHIEDDITEWHQFVLKK